MVQGMNRNGTCKKADPTTNKHHVQNCLECSHLDLGREFLSWKFMHKPVAKVEKSCLVRDAKKTMKTKEVTCGIKNWREEQTSGRMNKTPNWPFEKTEW